MRETPPCAASNQRQSPGAGMPLLSSSAAPYSLTCIQQAAGRLEAVAVATGPEVLAEQEPPRECVREAASSAAEKLESCGGTWKRVVASADLGSCSYCRQLRASCPKRGWRHNLRASSSCSCLHLRPRVLALSPRAAAAGQEAWPLARWFAAAASAASLRFEVSAA